MNLPTSILIAVMLIGPPSVLPPLRLHDALNPLNHDVIERFLTQRTAPLESAVTFRHLEATTRGGAMRGWLDACTVITGNDMRYSIVGEGGSGAVRKRALIAALDGEVKARQRGETGRASQACASAVTARAERQENK